MCDATACVGADNEDDKDLCLALQCIRDTSFDSEVLNYRCSSNNTCLPTDLSVWYGQSTVIALLTVLGATAFGAATVTRPAR